MRILLLFSITIFFVACNKNANQTVDSAYLNQIIPELKYSFSRNGMNSVDLSEVNIIKKNIYYLYDRFIKNAAIYNDIEYKNFEDYYKQIGNNDIYGNRGLKPYENIAISNLSKVNRSKIIKDIDNMFDSTTAIAGYKKGSTSTNNVTSGRRYKMVKKGEIGSLIGVATAVLGYTDMRGLVVAEAWLQMLLGAIALDKIINVHLDENTLNNPKLREDHANLKLVLRGGNYTELEHHLDLAYGYYKLFFNNLAKAEHLITLNGSEQKMINAFTLARSSLEKEDYNEMWRQIRDIRSLLSRIIATHILNLLAGNNTLSNLDSQEPSYAFPLISRAYGMIFALQFTRKPDGKIYFSYNQINDLLKSLLKNTGLWDTNRLLGSEKTIGSLRNIAQKIAERFNLSVADLR